jgi:hypothetical protein
MRTVKYFALAVLTLGVLSLGAFRAADKDDPAKPKMSIKDVMKKAHAKDASLAEKVTSGKATKEDKMALLDAYTQLAVNKPPKGDLDKWKDVTSEIVKEAQDVVDGKDGAEDKLKKAINCMNCHKEFRPPPPPKDK